MQINRREFIKGGVILVAAFYVKPITAYEEEEVKAHTAGWGVGWDIGWNVGASSIARTVDFNTNRVFLPLVKK